MGHQRMGTSADVHRSEGPAEPQLEHGSGERTESQPPAEDGGEAGARHTSGRDGAAVPVDLTSFVGRRDDVARVRRLLSASRLVTLTGIGGVGKTRLARQVAADVRRAFPDGVWFVDLADVHVGDESPEPGTHDPDVSARLVARALRVQDRSARSPLDVLTGYLEPRRLLLVLDNCERLLPACAVLVGVLLRASPHQRILATSRQQLDVGGEVIYPVPPLPVPDLGVEVNAADLVRVESAALFAARAAAVQPGFRIDEASSAAVAAICRHLDGLPLAIELAAARVRVLAPQQIQDRLEDRVTGRLTLLSGGSRSAPRRQQTMRACIDWSYDLCTEAERTLWARLSVFVGGFELDAVEGVCADDALPEEDLLDLVTTLVDKSILVRHDHGQVVRYRMLAVIREYGLHRLREADEQMSLRLRHRDWYVRFVRQAREDWFGPHQADCLARLSREFANLRAAIEVSLAESREPEHALGAVVAIPVKYWQVRALIPEARRWLNLALVQGTRPTPLRARAQLRAGHLAFADGDVETAAWRQREGEELARHLNAAAELAYAAYLRSLLAMARGDLALAAEEGERALGVLAGVPGAERELGLTLLNGRALLAGMLGDRQRAAECGRAIHAISDATGDLYYRARSMTAEALAAWCHDDHAETLRLAAESLQQVRRQGAGEPPGSWDRLVFRLDLELIAWVAARQRQFKRAATLLGAAETLRTELRQSAVASDHLSGRHDACVRDTREGMGVPAYDAAHRRGRTLAHDEMIAFALGEPQPTTTVPAASARNSPTPLTRREQQVADLISEGRSNREIAATLVISQRTAEGHVENILSKLGFTSRAQIAAWATGRQRANQE